LVLTFRQAAVYPPLVLLTRSIRLADEPFLAILTALLTPSSGANPSQRLLTLLVILNDRSGWDQGLGEEGSERLAGMKRLGETVVADEHEEPTST
jgi:U3 small nucleolar RNA-associated protein 10